MDLDDETLTALRTAVRLGFYVQPDAAEALLSALDTARADTAILRAEQRATAAWLVSTGYPVDWSTPASSPPAHLREDVVRAWWETSNDDGTTLADWWRLCVDEGGWPAEDLDDRRPDLRVVEND